MGENPLFSTHKRFGAGYDSNLGIHYPGAIYYATRHITNGVDSFERDVETVNVRLGSGDDTFRVDSVSDYGQTNVFGGEGNDTLSVGSTGTGIQPKFTHRVDFVHGSLALDGGAGENTLTLDDSGDDNPNVGTYLGTTVSGLDMDGSITLANAQHISIQLGASGDTFYIPKTDASLTFTLDMGDLHADTVYVGTTQGHENSGNLDGIQGDVLIEGQGPEAGDTLYLNDQAGTGVLTYTMQNEITGTRQLANGQQWPVDTTTFYRTGTANIQYRTMETVVLNASAGDDTIDIEGTHREQAVDGGKASSLTINAGPGADLINLGAPVATGGYTLEG